MANSSATRVVPVFDALFDADPSGRLWLPQLLRLGSHANEVSPQPEIGEMAVGHQRWWGANERRLRPSVRLLEWLVRNITEAAVEKSGDKGDTRQKRLLLARRHAGAVAEALSELRKPYRGRPWYVLEGESCPDAFIQTNAVLLVVEGKHTETSCTTKTKWMPRRSQMLRHMDAASEIRGKRQVLGLLIVEGKSVNGGTDTEPSRHWFKQATQEISATMLEASLPHRTPEEQRRLAAGFLGVTTWQRVCRELGLPWPPV